MIGYLDLPSGLSGDMLLGCLVDAGWPVERLRTTIRALPLPADEWAIEARPVTKGSLRATRVEVRVAAAEHPRHLRDIRDIVERADLDGVVKQRALAVFDRLAAAEARVHATTPERVHFHEIGAVDAIIDVVGSVAGLHELGVARLHAGAVPLGDGWTDSAHGRIPLPAPATLELLAAARMPTRPAPGPGEWLTPTGAALLAELATFSQPHLALERVGTGAGQRDSTWPNVARLWLGTEAHAASDRLVQLDTNIDDMNPQLFTAVSDRLFAAGARDVWLTPIQMKKGRPAVTLSVIAAGSLGDALSELILQQTTTLDVRVHELAGRYEAARDVHEVSTPFGTVRVKVKWLRGEPVGAAPEYDDCLAAAQRAKVPAKEAYDAAVVAAHHFLATLRAAYGKKATTG